VHLYFPKTISSPFSIKKKKNVYIMHAKKYIFLHLSLSITSFFFLNIMKLTYLIALLVLPATISAQANKWCLVEDLTCGGKYQKKCCPKLVCDSDIKKCVPGEDDD
jgi:hypothetical protein